MKLPKAKSANIVVQDLRDELLVYNLATHRAFTLNETSKVVYEACNGVTTFDTLRRRHRFTDDLIHFALDELTANDLLEGYQSNHFGSLSRREIIKRVGLASMIALPVIAGMTAPAAATAASANLCQRNRCIDGQGPPATNSPGCNPPAGCPAIGSICCAFDNSCVCTDVDSCRRINGQVCS